MKYLLLVHHNEEDFAKMPETVQRKMLAESIQLCHQLNGKGEYVHASPLQPVATATVVRVHDGKRSVTDGPFVETPNPMPGESEIEILQVFEAEDFGAELTPELRAQEDRVRAQAAHNT